MLLSFSVENFRAFAQEAALDLTSPGFRTNVPPAGKTWCDVAEPVAGIFGPNAAGKSTLLHALGVLSHAIRQPRVLLHFPTLDGSAAADAPTRYRVEFVVDGVRYDYAVVTRAWGIEHEELSAFPKGSRRLIFRRTQSEPGAAVKVEKGGTLTGPTREVSRVTTSTALFLATAHQYGHSALAPIAKGLMHGRGITSLAFPERQDVEVLHRVVAEMVAEPTAHVDLVRALAHAGDLGLEGIEVRREEVSEEDQERARRFIAAMNEGTEIDDFDLPRFAEVLVFSHRGADGTTFELPVQHESAGTITWLTIIWHALDALRKGSVLLIDELDASLHPALSRYVVELFTTPHLNPRGAQLIFTSHDVSLLGNAPVKLLTPPQVWFVEKDGSGRAELFGMEEFDNRAGNNNERRYLAGAFGAVPDIDDSLIRRFLSSPMTADAAR